MAIDRTFVDASYVAYSQWVAWLPITDAPENYYRDEGIRVVT